MVDSEVGPFETLSSSGFCGGWFIWCRWLLVVIVPGGGCRVPRRLRARRGFASRWRSVAGRCPYQWTHSAVASTGGVDVLPGSLAKGLARPCTRSLSASARAKPKGAALRAYRGDRLGLGLGVGQGLLVANGPVLHPTVASDAPGPSGQHRLVSVARRPFSGRPGPGRCTLAGRWSASR